MGPASGETGTVSGTEATVDRLVAPASSPERPTDHGRTDDAATRAFSTSIAVSAVRCLLAYVVFPWVLPAAGVAGGLGPGIGIAVGLVAIGFNALSIRRFWRADHRWKWPITVLNSTVIGLLSILLVVDVGDLLS